MNDRFVLIIAGTAGAGKDTLAEMVKEILERWTTVRTDAYAHTLKEVAHIALGVPWHILTAEKSVKESTFVHIGSQQTDITIRKTLQDIGEWFRQNFGPLIWANSVRSRAQFANEKITIVTDARHPKEEIHWMRDNCGFAERVFVVRIRNSRVPVKRGHPSEDLIDDEPDSSFDFIIENEGTLEDLRATAYELACACVVLTKTGKKKIKRSGDGWRPATAILEPAVTAEDAETLGSNMQKITYKSLKGNACGD